MTQTANLDPHTSGDWWPGMLLTLELGDPAEAWDLTGFSATMHVRRNPGDADIAAQWSTAAGTITLPDPEAGQLRIAGVEDLELPPTLHHYDLQITTPAGRTITIINGTWQILRQVTRPE